MVGLKAKVGSVRLSWIRSYSDDEKVTWKIVFSYWLNRVKWNSIGV